VLVLIFAAAFSVAGFEFSFISLVDDIFVSYVGFSVFFAMPDAFGSGF
jgi:hypothetical protein